MNFAVLHSLFFLSQRKTTIDPKNELNKVYLQNKELNLTI